MKHRKQRNKRCHCHQSSIKKILEQYENYKAPLNSVLKVTNSQMQKCKMCPKKRSIVYEMRMSKIQ